MLFFLILYFYPCACVVCCSCFFFFSSRRRHTRYWRDWSSDVCSSDLGDAVRARPPAPGQRGRHPGGQRAAGAAQRGTRRPDRRRPGRPPPLTVPDVVVVGDLATDVVVLLDGDPAPESDRPAWIRSRGGGAGANVAVPLARLGTPVTLAGCVGDYAAGTGL